MEIKEAVTALPADLAPPRRRRFGFAKPGFHSADSARRPLIDSRVYFDITTESSEQKNEVILSFADSRNSM